MMATLLFYSYAVGVFSSRKIAAACERNLAFLAIVGADRPDFRTISHFRRIHLEPLSALFVQVLKIAGMAGLVKLGNIAIDGSKFKANASRHKAMSYGYMKKEVVRLRESLFLVDTGAIDCLVPGNQLTDIGLIPEGRRSYELADGTEHAMDITVARVEFMGEIVGATASLAPMTEPILGVTALESVGITVGC